MSRQLQAGFYSDVLLNSIRKHYKDNAVEVTIELLNSLCFFETDLAPRTIKIDKESELFSLLSVYHNYLQRGLPTHANIIVEDYLEDIWGDINSSVSDIGTIEYKIDDVSNEFTKLLFSSLFIIDPRISEKSIDNLYWRTWLGSELEKKFLNQHFLSKLGNHWLQLIEPQRSVTNILQYAYQSGEYIKELYNQPIDSMGEQRVDFAIDLPCVFSTNGRRGLILEIDGSQHTYNKAQFNLDQYRDQAMLCLEHTNWATVRAKSEQWSDIPKLLNNYQSFFSDKYFEKILENYNTPLWKQPDGIKALNIALTPIGVARIQKCLIELILNGKLELSNSVWNIGIIERDVDCAWIAIEDFKDCWNRFNQLSEHNLKLPEINLTIFNTPEFSVEQFPIEKKSISEANTFIGDLLIDISVIQRWGLSEPIRVDQSVYTVCIRSAHSKKEVRSFLSAPLIKYKPLIQFEEQQTLLFWDKIEHINYFIKSVFRKRSLRPGQLPIINKALQLNSVIGLLPTGGGKSLTYQICSLLQPGLALIIDPIKSLMLDQHDGLIKNGIDASVFVNSSLKTHFERKWAQDQLMEGRVLFVFISPERLQIPAFRNALGSMHELNEKYFSYCVIDEAHCVSEWGHDFRTSYLRLGDNARRFCKTWKGKSTITLFGLTATASFDVLSDVKRELKIGDENVISSLSSHREELIYQIYPIKTGLHKGAKGYAASQSVGKAKVDALKVLLAQLPDQIYECSKVSHRPNNFDRTNFYSINEKNKYENAVLIFCPHKSEKSPMGVNYVAPKLVGANLKVGTFYGADSADGLLNEVLSSEDNQTRYIKNDINLLVATKAFGMGIDKPNVRSTIHFNFPSSIESFVQEAGRAGRDRKRAICNILYSNDAEHIDRELIYSFHSNNFKGIEHDYAMLLELLKEISYPAQKISNEISQEIFEDLGEIVQIKEWKSNNFERLYVNKAFKVGYGYIDLKNLQIFNKDIHPEIDINTSSIIMNYIVEFIKKNSPGLNYYDWIQSEIVGNTQPGIEELFKKIPIGDNLPEIEISFRNNRINLIANLLQSNIDERISEYIIDRAASFCNNFQDFIANLTKEFIKKENIDISEKFPLEDDDINKLIESYFYQIREEGDTYKAIYRLTVLGVIDDYEVDYSSKSIKLKIQRKSDEQYLNCMEDYLIRYLSPKRVSELMQIVQEGNKGSVIRNCAYSLIEYIYKFIGSKRERAIKEMQSICEIGVSSNDPEEIKRTIGLYFNSKYTEDLLQQTDQGTTFNLEVVEEYIELTQGIADNLEHLRGSTSRILVDNPDNGAMLVLRAFSALLLETKYVREHLAIRNQFLVDKALEDLENGLIQYEENGFKLLDILNLIRNELLAQNPGLEKIIEDITLLLSVKQHTKWTKNFNKKYLSSI
jgi:ATP-dependent DNA helicase RecQ